MSTIKGNDEIADLSHAFHSMAGEMDILVNRTLRLTISERNAKIRAMQSQISPHFLYNALDCVNWNLLKKGDFESSQLLVSLSSILRYSIDDTKSTVTVREEFEQVEYSKAGFQTGFHIMCIWMGQLLRNRSPR